MILRESMFLNSILVSCESWYGVNKRHIELLEAADVRLFQIFFKSHSKTVGDAYFAETGSLKINQILSKRRLMYHHHILHRDVNELIRKAYIAQSLKPTRNDFWKAVKTDQKYYEINLSDDEISSMSKGVYKKFIEEKIYRKATEEILQSRKSKMQMIIKSVKCDKKGKLMTQSYIKTNKLTPLQTLFELRAFNFQTKSNYKSQYQEDMSCRICLQEDSFEDEEHTFFDCNVLMDDIDIEEDIKFEDVFGTLEAQIKAVKYFTKIIEKRNIILDIRQKP